MLLGTLGATAIYSIYREFAYAVRSLTRKSPGGDFDKIAGQGDWHATLSFALLSAIAAFGVVCVGQHFGHFIPGFKI